MLINCSTCLELLTPSCELSSAPCGHVFHSDCINKWLETGKKNCPQCRSKCSFNQLRRIFFTEGVDISQDVDANTLQNKLDSVTFQLRCCETEKKNAHEKVNELSAHKIALKEEFKELERKYKTNADEMLMLKNQVRMLQGEKERSKVAREKVRELETKLETFQTIKLALQGTLPQMNERLHSLNDYSDNARQLCQVAEVLKKALVDKGNEVKQLFKQLQQKTNECNLEKSKKDENVVKVTELNMANNQLRRDLDRVEEENNDLRTKLNKLQEAIVSPSGDPKSSAISRLVNENVVPMFLDNSPPTPKTTLKSCGIVGLKKQRSPCKNVSNSLKRSISNQVPVQQSLFSKKPKMSASQPAEVKPDYFYNGLGGHSKADEFPSRKNFTLSKKPKGVSNPKNSQKMATINKYFNFDTP